MTACTALACVVAFSVGASAPEAGAPLRYDSFVVFQATKGERVSVTVRAVPKAGFAYKDEVRVVVIDPASRWAHESRVPLGQTRTLHVDAAAGGLHAVCLQSGSNLAETRVAGRPWAWVARREAPVHISGRPTTLWFAPPEGLTGFSIFVHARVKGEAAIVRVSDPDGRVVLTREDDFDKLTRLEIKPARPTTGRPWRLDVLDPGKPGFGLDDVSVWLGPALQPLVCPKPEWLGAFKGVTGVAPEKISRRVRVNDRRLGVTQATPREVRFRLTAVPKARVAALRVQATDVDYGTESPVTVNGAKLFLPVTGDGVTADVTLRVAPGVLRQGENVIAFGQDPSGGSRTYAVTRIELLFGDAINVD